MDAAEKARRPSSDPKQTGTGIQIGEKVRMSPGWNVMLETQSGNSQELLQQLHEETEKILIP